MTPNELRELVAAATPGPWIVDETHISVDTGDGRALVLMDDRDNEDDRQRAVYTARLIALAFQMAELLADAQQIIGVFQFEEPDLMTADLAEWQGRFEAL